MQIWYVLSGKSGVTSFTYRELELLEAEGVRITLLFTQLRSGNLMPRSSWSRVVFRISRLPGFLLRRAWAFPFSAAFYYSLLRGELRHYLVAAYFRHALRDQRPDKIHVQMGDHKLLIGDYLRRGCKAAALSATLHAHELYSGLSRSRRFRELLISCQRLFTISEFNRRILADEIGVPADRVEVMYLYPAFEPIGLVVKKKILMTGNWERKKGYEEALRAVKVLSRPDVVLLIAGTNVNPGVDLDLPAMIREMGLERQALLLGHVNRVVLEFLYSACDVFLLPSKTDYHSDGSVAEREGIPVALMEAMSFGMPVISTRHAGIPELVSEPLEDEGDVKALAERLEFLLDHPDEARRQGRSNAKRVAEKFSTQNARALVRYFAP